MTSSPRQATDGPDSGGQAFPLVLELSLADIDPVSGTVGVAGGPPAVPFHGWIDLMSAINNLRAGASEPGRPGRLKVGRFPDGSRPPGTVTFAAGRPRGHQRR